MKVDIDLLTKYNRPGPRYTSYPTAVQFSTDFSAADYAEEIRATNAGGDMPDLSLYFHLPFCKTMCYFCGCTTIITKKLDKIDTYLRSLEREIDTIAGMIHPDRKIVQLHWGGGTPSYLSDDQITELMRLIHDRFNFADDAEVSMEIDPRNLSDDFLPVIRRAGFNRVSFGVQDVNPEVQQAINRVQPDELNEFVVTESRALDFDSVNIDLIYGLPYQTASSFAGTLDKVLALDPDRFAIFNYAHVPWLKPHQKVMPVDAMPSAEERLNILKLTIERLTDAGYQYLGMDHFAKPNDELSVAAREGTLHRNFQGYTTRGHAEIYAMGMSSISQLKNVYAQNEKSEPAYRERIDKGEIPTHAGYRLNDDDHLRRYVIMQIMCNSVLQKADVEKRFGIQFDAYFADALGRMGEFVSDGLLTLHSDRLEVSEEGRLVIRNIAMEFDAHLSRDAGSETRFSRTV